MTIPLKITIVKNGVVEPTIAYKIDTLSQVSQELFRLPAQMKIIDKTSIDNN